MLRNLLASGASALVGFGLVGSLPPMSAYRGGQDGEAKPKKVEGTISTTVTVAAEDTEALLHQAYERLRRIKSERLEDRQKALVERASEMYRRAIKAYEAKQEDPARATALAALELARAVEQARAAREIARPDPDLPAPPATPAPPAPPAPPVAVVAPLTPTAPLPPLPPPMDVTIATAPRIAIAPRAIAEGKKYVTRTVPSSEVKVVGKLEAKPGDEAQVIELRVDEPKVTVEGKANVESGTFVVQNVEGKPIMVRTEPLRAITLAEKAKGQDPTKALRSFTYSVPLQGSSPAEARAQVQKAYEAVKKAREAKKDGENRGVLDTARDLYNSARAAAEAGENAKAIGLAQAAISLAGVPSVDALAIKEKTEKALQDAKAEARKAQAELERHRAVLEKLAKDQRDDQAAKEKALKEVEIEVTGARKQAAEALAQAKVELDKQRHALTIARDHAQAQAHAKLVEGKPAQIQVQTSGDGQIQVQVATQTTDKDGKAETSVQIHAFKDGKEIPADQLKLEKKGDAYILRLDPKVGKQEKEAKKDKEKGEAKPKEEVKVLAPRVFIENLEKKVAEEIKSALDDSIVGIGVSIREDEGKLLVQDTIAGGPAAKDGRIKQGDQIVGVEDKDGKVVEFAGKPLAEAVELIRGPEGSKLKLVVQPVGSVERKTYELTRAKVAVPKEPEAPEAKASESPKDKGGELPPEIKD
ncbi:MAG: PDZ domain-containing protein [Isosphaeraceae bacterium]